MRFSRTAAVIVGVIAPVGETIRRWSTWRQNPPALFDDYLVGLLLLSAVWVYRKDTVRGRVLLAGGWGLTCGMAYVSIFSQIAAIGAGLPDPAPIPSGWVLGIKLLGGALAVLGLAFTVRG
jgi:hypothetical protein